ncbi:hypothetical protein DL93DRAFT_2231410 [Clavulina sp. PMI_390]|nr:hypothetical protein DL93DRAFT_2231410 [Clavulina sp. PMI_390]
METLPFEVISAIFSDGLPTFSTSEVHRDNPTMIYVRHQDLIDYLNLITSISHDMRQIALQSPHLWTHIVWGDNAEFLWGPENRYTNYKRGLELTRVTAYLERSKNALLNITFDGTHSSKIRCEEAWRILRPQLSRCRRLFLMMPCYPRPRGYEVVGLSSLDDVCLPLPNTMESLETLIISGDLESDDSSVFLSETSASAPRLRDFRIDGSETLTQLLHRVISPNSSPISTLSLVDTVEILGFSQAMESMSHTLRKLKLSWDCGFMSHSFSGNPIEFPVLEALEVHAYWDFSFAEYFVTPSLRNLSLTRRFHTRPHDLPSATGYPAPSYIHHCMWPHLTSLALDPVRSWRVSWLNTVFFELLRANPEVQELDCKMTPTQAMNFTRFLGLSSPSSSASREVSSTVEEPQQTPVPMLQRVVLRRWFVHTREAQLNDGIRPEDLKSLLGARPNLYIVLDLDLTRMTALEAKSLMKDFGARLDLKDLCSYFHSRQSLWPDI